jgi:GT2 family glycosyltransferase
MVDRDNSNTYPSVAVVVPCRNEKAYIEACVMSVLEQEYHGKLTVVVADGFSDDGTREILDKLSKTYPNVQMVDNEKRTTPYALNLGIQHAHAEVSIILGGHAKLLPGYILKCVQALQRDSSLGCVGGIIDSVHENDAARVISLAMSSSFGVGNAHFRTGNKSGYVDTVAFGAYRKSVFEKVGYFDADLTRNQDDEFNYRILKAGFKIWLDPEIRSLYYVQNCSGNIFSMVIGKSLSIPNTKPLPLFDSFFLLYFCWLFFRDFYLP